MSKLRISTEKMASISNVWLTEVRGNIAAIPQAAALLPDIEAMHGELVIARDTPPPVNELLRALIKSMFGLDLTHDRYFRTGYRLIQAQQALAVVLARKDEEAKLEELEKELYPQGLLGTTLAYEEQEGAALRLESSLNDGLKKRLQLLSMTAESGESFSLLTMVERHIEAAKALGIADRQKRTLQAQESAPTPSVVDERKARLSWIQVANTLESVLSMALKRKTIAPESVKAILGGLEEAEADADREYEEKKASSQR